MPAYDVFSLSDEVERLKKKVQELERTLTVARSREFEKLYLLLQQRLLDDYPELEDLSDYLND